MCGAVRGAVRGALPWPRARPARLPQGWALEGAQDRTGQDRTIPVRGRPEWPEAEKAEKLARGAALKWASGVFYRPEKLEALGQYRSRETKRNNSIQARLKSTVQSYLEGVSAGLEQLRAAAEEVQSVRRELGAARWALGGSAERRQDLQRMRALMAEHVQLASVVKVLPQLFSAPVPVFSRTLELLHEQHLLEAHAELMMLEQLRDDVLFQLHLRGLSSAQATVLSYFRGLQELNESLAKQLWGIVGRSLQLVREDPVLFVSAVRIIEREEKIDDALLLDATFLPPGRPKGWRQKFYHVLQETITGSRLLTARVDTTGPGLSRHLAALQREVVAELLVVKDLMVQCVPAHYNILSICPAMYHQALSSHLQDILQEDLDKQGLFLLLEWVLHVYQSPEMMGHPGLLPEVDVSALGPLISPDLVDQTERKYVVKVKASVLEWMQRTLEVEFKEWFREEEPETDHQGFFQSALPVIVMQMLSENIRVASLITASLQQKVYGMALEELEAFLGRLREALVQCGKEHQKERAVPTHYVPYLLATLNNSLALSSSVSSLHPDTAPREVPASLQAALDRTQRKACQLLLEELLLDLQVGWAVASAWPCICSSALPFSPQRTPRARTRVQRLLLTESERLVTSQYVRALMQRRMVCRGQEERGQLCRRLLQDATQLRELFQGLGLDRSQQSLEAVFALRELICLKDPALLSLEVLGFITKYPDVSDEHVSSLLDLRGDVSKELRHMVLEMMAQHPQAPPEGYQSIFSTILVPAPELPFCLRKGKCA
uniref:Exocyst complex component 3-like protein n=1 Tax=Nothoprocta perdicaria TaxID=30464 RepID=A0A8C6ZWS0_NOTPE